MILDICKFEMVSKRGPQVSKCSLMEIESHADFGVI